MRPRPPDRSDRRAIGLFFAAVTLVYTCIFPYMAWVNNPNENVRTYMTMAIVEKHTFVIDDILLRHGWTNDMALVPAKAGVPEHRYSIKGPAVSYAAVPVYWLFTKIAPRVGYALPTERSPPEEREAWLRAATFVLRLFVVQLPCLSFLFFFERWLRRYAPDAVLRLSAVAACGLGTNYLAYSLMFVSHALFACTSFLTFAIATDALFRPRGERRLRSALACGFFCGLAPMLDYQALVVSVVLAVYALFAFYRPTRLAMFTLGGLVDVAGLTFYQWRAFGNPLTPGHKLAETTTFATKHAVGLYGITKPDWEVFFSLFGNRTYGFLGTSPYMWLGLLGCFFGAFAPAGSAAFRRRIRVLSIVWGLAMAVLWLALSAANNWRGGWTIGPRLLGAAPPFFAFGAATLLSRMAGDSTRGRKHRRLGLRSHRATRRAVARGLAAGLAIASFLQIGLCSLVFNSLPESVTRPLTQFSIPLLREGFVPHHVGELVGLTGTAFYYTVLGVLALALAVALFRRARDPWGRFALRLFVAFGALGLGVSAATTATLPEEGDNGEGEAASIAAQWEPAGRDRIATLRVTAERLGKHAGCAWVDVADAERVVHWDRDASRDQARAGIDPARCPKGLFERL